MSETKLIRVRIVIPTASGNRKGWLKRVTSVDTSKSNGYAFEGNFLDAGEHDLPLGAVVIEKCPSGSAKHGYDVPNCAIVTETGLEWQTCPGKDWRKDFLSFRDFVASLVVKQRQTVADNSVRAQDARTMAIRQIQSLMRDYNILIDDLK